MTRRDLREWAHRSMVGRSHLTKMGGRQALQNSLMSLYYAPHEPASPQPKEAFMVAYTQQEAEELLIVLASEARASAALFEAQAQGYEDVRLNSVQVRYAEESEQQAAYEKGIQIAQLLRAKAQAGQG